MPFPRQSHSRSKSRSPPRPHSMQSVVAEINKGPQLRGRRRSGHRGRGPRPFSGRPNAMPQPNRKDNGKKPTSSEYEKNAQYSGSEMSDDFKFDEQENIKNLDNSVKKPVPELEKAEEKKDDKMNPDEGKGVINEPQISVLEEQKYTEKSDGVTINQINPDTLNSNEKPTLTDNESADLQSNEAKFKAESEKEASTSQNTGQITSEKDEKAKEEKTSENGQDDQENSKNTMERDEVKEESLKNDKDKSMFEEADHNDKVSIKQNAETVKADNSEEMSTSSDQLKEDGSLKNEEEGEQMDNSSSSSVPVQTVDHCQLESAEEGKSDDTENKVEDLTSSKRPEQNDEIDEKNNNDEVKKENTESEQIKTEGSQEGSQDVNKDDEEKPIKGSTSSEVPEGVKEDYENKLDEPDPIQKDENRNEANESVDVFDQDKENQGLVKADDMQADDVKEDLDASTSSNMTDQDNENESIEEMNDAVNQSIVDNSNESENVEKDNIEKHENIQSTREEKEEDNLYGNQQNKEGLKDDRENPLEDPTKVDRPNEIDENSSFVSDGVMNKDDVDEQLDGWTSANLSKENKEQNQFESEEHSEQRFNDHKPNKGHGKPHSEEPKGHDKHGNGEDGKSNNSEEKTEGSSYPDQSKEHGKYDKAEEEWNDHSKEELSASDQRNEQVTLENTKERKLDESEKQSEDHSNPDVTDKSQEQDHLENTEEDETNHSEKQLEGFKYYDATGQDKENESIKDMGEMKGNDLDKQLDDLTGSVALEQIKQDGNQESAEELNTHQIDRNGEASACAEESNNIKEEDSKEEIMNANSTKHLDISTSSNTSEYIKEEADNIKSKDSMTENSEHGDVNISKYPGEESTKDADLNKLEDENLQKGDDAAESDVNESIANLDTPISPEKSTDNTNDNAVNKAPFDVNTVNADKGMNVIDSNVPEEPNSMTTDGENSLVEIKGSSTSDDSGSSSMSSNNVPPLRNNATDEDDVYFIISKEEYENISVEDNDVFGGMSLCTDDSDDSANGTRHNISCTKCLCLMTLVGCFPLFLCYKFAHWLAKKF